MSLTSPEPEFDRGRGPGRRGEDGRLWPPICQERLKALGAVIDAYWPDAEPAPELPAERMARTDRFPEDPRAPQGPPAGPEGPGEEPGIVALADVLLEQALHEARARHPDVTTTSLCQASEILVRYLRKQCATPVLALAIAAMALQGIVALMLREDGAADRAADRDGEAG